MGAFKARCRTNRLNCSTRTRSPNDFGLTQSGSAPSAEKQGLQGDPFRYGVGQMLGLAKKKRQLGRRCLWADGGRLIQVGVLLYIDYCISTGGSPVETNT
jgi:hypothetical protein